MPTDEERVLLAEVQLRDAMIREAQVVMIEFLAAEDVRARALQAMRDFLKKANHG